jgi:hypothetical protein
MVSQSFQFYPSISNLGELIIATKGSTSRQVVNKSTSPLATTSLNQVGTHASNLTLQKGCWNCVRRFGSILKGKTRRVQGRLISLGNKIRAPRVSSIRRGFSRGIMLGIGWSLVFERVSCVMLCYQYCGEKIAYKGLCSDSS